MFFDSIYRNAGYDLGAERLYERRPEFIDARLRGHATGDRYRRLTALLADSVEERPRWSSPRVRAQGICRDAAQNTELLQRVQQSRREQEPSLEL